MAYNPLTVVVALDAENKAEGEVIVDDGISGLWICTFVTLIRMYVFLSLSLFYRPSLLASLPSHLFLPLSLPCSQMMIPAMRKTR
jgi:hypothetical protein